MTPTLVQRDERTIAFENAGYRWSYLFLSFGLLALVAYRSFARHESPWDLLALVILGGAVGTVYQGYHRVLSRRWALLCLAAIFIAAVVAGILLVGRGAPSAKGAFESAKLAAMSAVKDHAVSTAGASLDTAKKSFDELSANTAANPGAIATIRERLDAAARAVAELKAAPVEDWRAANGRASTALAALNDAIKAALDGLPR